MNTSLAVRTSSPIAFQNVTFDVIDRNGQPWLRHLQIEGALGYKASGRALQLLYKKHAAEFTDNMTALVKLQTPGGEQETRIFSLRGAHLLGMFARTPVAAEFRRWVLDILDAELERLRDAVIDARDQKPAYVVNRSINAEQYQVLQAMIAERHLPGDTRERFVAKLAWNFRAKQLVDLPERYFIGALQTILRQPLASATPKAESPSSTLPAPIVPAVPAVTAARPFGGAETVWLTRFDCHNVGRTEQVPADSFVFRVSEIPDMVREPGGHVPRKMLPGIIDACVSRLK